MAFACNFQVLLLQVFATDSKIFQCLLAQPEKLWTPKWGSAFARNCKLITALTFLTPFCQVIKNQNLLRFSFNFPEYELWVFPITVKVSSWYLLFVESYDFLNWEAHLREKVHFWILKSYEICMLCSGPDTSRLWQCKLLLDLPEK